MCYGFFHVFFHSTILLSETEKMSKLPEKLRKRLKEEAHNWESALDKE